MPRSPEDNQQLKDARRIAILRAATRVFAKKGFANTKISDLAKEAGLSHGLVYHYFENKDAVFQAILEDKLESSRAMMKEDDSLPGTALDRMRTSIANWLERVQQDPDMAHVITQGLVSNALTEETRSMMRSYMREGYQNATLRIAQGQERGEIGTHATAGQLATLLLCFMRGLSFMTNFDYGIRFEVPSVDTLVRIMLPSSQLATPPGTIDASATAAPQKRAARVTRAPQQTSSKKSSVRKAAR
jgi:AcrR family transcriptional regulator